MTGRPLVDRQPEPEPEMDFAEVVRRRRMVRRYDPNRALPDGLLDRIVDVALRAPSAGFTQGVSFLIMESAADRERFWQATTDPDAPADRWLTGMRAAPGLIMVLTSAEAYLDRYALADKGWTDRSTEPWTAPYWFVDAGMAAMAALYAVVDLTGVESQSDDHGPDEPDDHEPDDHEPGHGPGDGGVGDHESADYGPGDDELGDHETTAHEPGVHEVSDRVSGDHQYGGQPTNDHGVGDHGAGVHETGGREPGVHEASDRVPADHERGDRSTNHPDAAAQRLDDLGACFFGVPADRADQVRRAFGIPAEQSLVGVISVGHRAADERPSGSPRKRPRKPRTELVHHSTWTTEPTSSS